MTTEAITIEATQAFHRRIASIIADNEQLPVGAADYKPAAPHPLAGGPRPAEAMIDSPAEEPPSGG